MHSNAMHGYPNGLPHHLHCLQGCTTVAQYAASQPDKSIFLAALRVGDRCPR